MGDIMLVETNHCRDYWLLCRIMKDVPEDGIIQSVEILVKFLLRLMKN